MTDFANTILIKRDYLKKKKETSNCVFVTLQLTKCTLEPNLCDEKRTTQCEEYAVCCSLGNEQYGCCPFTGGTCCPGTSHCCPPGFTCTKTGTCKRTSTITKPVDPNIENMRKH